MIGGWSYIITRTNAGNGYQINTKTQKRRNIRRSVLNVNKGYPGISVLEFKWVCYRIFGVYVYIYKYFRSVLKLCFYN